MKQSRLIVAEVVTVMIPGSVIFLYTICREFMPGEALVCGAIGGLVSAVLVPRIALWGSLASTLFAGFAGGLGVGAALTAIAVVVWVCLEIATSCGIDLGFISFIGYAVYLVISILVGPVSGMLTAVFLWFHSVDE